MLKPFALPRPEWVDIAAREALLAPGDHDAVVQEMRRRRVDLAQELSRVTAQLESLTFFSTCGSRDDSQDVELYDGAFPGVSTAFVQQHQRPVGQIQWAPDLAQRLAASGAIPGDVAGKRWATGVLFSDDLFLTAGHCFLPSNDGNTFPSRGGFILRSKELAPLMQVNFDFQLDRTTHPPQVRNAQTFPIVELKELGKPDHVDFAIVRLGPNNLNQLPGQVFGKLEIATHDLTTSNAVVCVIQHPNGKPKRVAAGSLLGNVAGRISYASIDTSNGASGAPVVSAADGKLVGVHTRGGCALVTGANSGAAIGAIRAVSHIL